MKWSTNVAFCASLPLVLVLCIAPSLSHAQTTTTGDNGVYSGSTCCTPVRSFVDINVAIHNDICQTIHDVLIGQTPTWPAYPTNGEVIDARGISGTALTCASGTPWNTGSGIINVPSTILLPAGIITIPQTWILPSNTHLVGQGDNALSGTTIKAKASGFSGSAMIQMGDSSIGACCKAISVENLNLNGKVNTINGIVNQNSQDFSYVDHVGIFQVLGTGLLIAGSATDSGPYSNITFDLGSNTPSSSTYCASIQGTSGTRGIRGLSCSSTSNNAGAAILLDASNNTLEDVRIVGFQDGVRVGANQNAAANVLVNVLGDTHPPLLGGPIYVVHIENAGHTVSDLTIMGVSNSTISGTYTIYDEITGIHLTDTSVGLYALGEPKSNGHSLFTTSPHAPGWAFGSSQPSNSCIQGSIYSCTGNGTNCMNKALWGCPAPGGTWQGIM